VSAPSRFDSVLAAETASLGIVDDQQETIAARRRAPLPAGPEDAQQASKEPAGPTVPRRIGLALSGGGIRSATFSLGVLQALAARDKLFGIDYLSTVSGGGYIGSWLTAWIHRRGLAEVAQQLKASVEHDDAKVVQAQVGKVDQFRKAREARALDKAATREGGPETTAPAAPLPATSAGMGQAQQPLVEPLEITWLRRYSNYLAPRVGVLSTDSLTLFMTWVRNTLLNLVIVVSLLATLFLAVHLVPYVPDEKWHAAQVWLGRIAGGVGTVLMFFFAYNLAKLVARESDYGGEWGAAARVRAVVWLAGIAATVCAGLWFFGGPVNPYLAYGWVLLLLTLVTLFWIWVAAKPAAEPRSLKYVPWTALWQYALAGATALVTSFLLFWAVRLLWPDVPLAAAITYGPALFLIAFGICGSVYIGISGRAYYERAREWWSRMNAVLIAAGFVWLALFWVALYAQPTFDWVVARFPTWTAILTTGWIASLIAILKGRIPVDASTRTRQNVELLLAILTAVAAIGFVIAVALAADFFFRLAAGIIAIPALPPDSALVDYLDARNELYDALSGPELAPFFGRVLGLTLAVAATFGLFGWRIDVNKFSLHNMYKNRLVRCYLGASVGPTRHPQPFTGFDDNDDIPLVDLAPTQRPFHIVNTALNLSQGKNLAWQERKAASFTFSRSYCGFELAPTQGDSTYRRLDDAERPTPGYLPTDEYADRSKTTMRGEDRKLSLGSALSTSGAAVSSVMGMHTSPLRAFMVTIFNARLGRWCPNPAVRPLGELSPSFGLGCFLHELFGGTNEDSKYVYLSDGGHFENLGLYELVRRRCSVIVVVDAAADPGRVFQDLGLAIRLCRVDFGCEITLDVGKLRSSPAEAPELAYAWGTVTYNPNTDPPEQGVILYLKPTLTRNALEPIDVQAYAKRNPTFPHQTTVDQFFDEGQFESYRRLGFYVGCAALSSDEAKLLPDSAPAAAQPPAPAPPAATKD